MANFCVKCGEPLSGGLFCAKCGADTRSAAPSAQAQPAPGLAQHPLQQSGLTPGQTPAAKQGMSPLAKLGVAAIAIIFVGGAVAVTGAFYAAHRVSEEFHEIKGGITGNASTDAVNSNSSTSSTSVSGGDPCRYLSKQDVGQAIGVEIVGTRIEGESCSYLAKGSAGDMAAKHASAILGSKGIDPNAQKMFEQFSKTIFKSMPQDRQDTTSDDSGKVPVLSLSVSDSASAIAEMKLNAKVMKNLGGSGNSATGEDLDLGDQAFVSSDSVIMVRKGGKVIRIMYMTCPCGTKEVIPLARKLVQSL
ncbi:MAG TPA: hypothetical protein VE377_20935 [Candidatus Dormibacteraeota bacterium]|nr:hypothetical protein [Candidatus Dormibacteraeota bacterium]